MDVETPKRLTKATSQYAQVIIEMKKDTAGADVMKQMLRSTTKQLEEKNRTIKAMKSMQSVRGKVGAVSKMRLPSFKKKGAVK